MYVFPRLGSRVIFLFSNWTYREFRRLARVLWLSRRLSIVSRLRMWQRSMSLGLRTVSRDQSLKCASWSDLDWINVRKKRHTLQHNTPSREVVLARALHFGLVLTLLIRPPPRLSFEDSFRIDEKSPLDLSESAFPKTGKKQKFLSKKDAEKVAETSILKLRAVASAELGITCLSLRYLRYVSENGRLNGLLNGVLNGRGFR